MNLEVVETGGLEAEEVLDTLSSSVTISGGTGAPGGHGAKGGNGKPGCVIFYYGVHRKIQGGRFVDKNGKQFLEKLSRRFIV